MSYHQLANSQNWRYKFVCIAYNTEQLERNSFNSCPNEYERMNSTYGIAISNILKKICFPTMMIKS